MELKQKPFHQIKFKSIYNEKDKPEQRRRILQPRKVKVHVTDEMFKRIVEIYRASGDSRVTRRTIEQEMNISTITITKYINKARAVVANKEEEKAQESALLTENNLLKANLAKWSEEAEIKYNRQAQTIVKLEKANKEKDELITKLQAKVEVLTDLVKGN